MEISENKMADDICTFELLKKFIKLIVDYEGSGFVKSIDYWIDFNEEERALLEQITKNAENP